MKDYTPEEVKLIRKLLRTTKDPVMYRKYLTIRLHMKGKTNKHISEMLDLDPGTIGAYIKTYKTAGVEGLVPQKPPGRPRFLSTEQEQKLYGTISNQTPDEAGFDGIANWAAKIACLWVLREFGVQYQINGMLDMFHRLGLSYTRPTYVLAKADHEKQRKFKDDFEDIKKTPQRSN